MIISQSLSEEAHIYKEATNKAQTPPVDAHSFGFTTPYGVTSPVLSISEESSTVLF